MAQSPPKHETRTPTSETCNVRLEILIISGPSELQDLRSASDHHGEASLGIGCLISFFALPMDCCPGKSIKKIASQLFLLQQGDFLSCPGKVYVEEIQCRMKLLF